MESDLIFTRKYGEGSMLSTSNLCCSHVKYVPNDMSSFFFENNFSIYYTQKRNINLFKVLGGVLDLCSAVRWDGWVDRYMHTIRM